jgi:hypothetical protein
MKLAALRARLGAFWRALRPWVLVRLRQPSTYAGLVMKLAAIAGLTVTDSAAGQIAEVVAVLVGAGLVAYDPGAKDRPDDSDQAGA